MPIEDRISPNSGEHWTLFALRAFADEWETPATAEALHHTTGERFESAAWIEERLEELVSRNLVSHSEAGYEPKPVGRTALKRRGEPSNPPWERARSGSIAASDEAPTP